MESEMLDSEAAEVAAMLPAGSRVAIIGSNSYWHAASEETCAALGRSLARLNRLVLVTGGVSGVAEGVGRSFCSAREGLGRQADVFHLLPRGSWRCDYGETVRAGSDMSERREILGRVAEVYVMVEGGPGTAHEASVARARSATVIPVGQSGGHAAVLYPQVLRPSSVPEHFWRTLGNADVSPERVVDAIVEIVRACVLELKHGVQRSGQPDGPVDHRPCEDHRV